MNTSLQEKKTKTNEEEAAQGLVRAQLCSCTPGCRPSSDVTDRKSFSPKRKQCEAGAQRRGCGEQGRPVPCEGAGRMGFRGCADRREGEPPVQAKPRCRPGFRDSKGRQLRGKHQPRALSGERPPGVPAAAPGQRAPAGPEGEGPRRR